MPRAECPNGGLSLSPELPETLSRKGCSRGCMEGLIQNSACIPALLFGDPQVPFFPGLGRFLTSVLLLCWVSRANGPQRWEALSTSLGMNCEADERRNSPCCDPCESHRGMADKRGPLAFAAVICCQWAGVGLPTNPQKDSVRKPAFRWPVRVLMLPSTMLIGHERRLLVSQSVILSLGIYPLHSPHPAEFRGLLDQSWGYMGHTGRQLGFVQINDSI